LKQARNAFRTLIGRADARPLTEVEFVSGLGDSAFLLYGLARALKPAVAVEIGSARGKSACYVGRALKENGAGKLYAIDPHMPTAWNDIDSVDTLSIMKKNIKALGVDSQVEILWSCFMTRLWDLKPDPQFARADMGVPAFVEELRAGGYPVITFDQNFGVSVVQPTPGGVALRALAGFSTGK
jgi:hypothetical protein